ncbi:MAG TPA: hypothetical protein VGU20_01590 [Stellaceae bacterium]|nr:hypothetical protein [Stellaceae bacterium]
MTASLHDALAREIEKQADEIMAEINALLAKMARLPHSRRFALVPQALELFARMEGLIPKYQHAAVAIAEFEGGGESKSSN